MKFANLKKILYLCIVLTALEKFVFAQDANIQAPRSFQIEDVVYKSKGKTNIPALKRLYKINKKKIFDSEDEFKSYISDIEKTYSNTRLFSEIEINYELLSSQDEPAPVRINITVDDAHNTLALPKPSYNSNEGAELKIKLKDKNFLGTLNTLNLEVNSHFGNEEHPNDFSEMEFGAAFDFDYPFNIGITENTWSNEVAFDWTIGDTEPEENISTGVKIGVPFGEENYFNVHFKQSMIRDLEYAEYDDEFYFAEEAGIDVPLTIGHINKYTSVVYTPSVTLTYNWDLDGIDPDDEDLLGPEMELAHQLKIDNENWQGNFRQGFYAATKPFFTWNFSSLEMEPGVEVEGKLFRAFKWFGITCDAYFYSMLNGEKNEVGARLRGIKDKQTYDCEDPELDDHEALKTPAGMAFNFDMPIHIVTTHWLDWGYNLFGSYDKMAAPLKLIGWLPRKMLKYLDFELQLSPFVDIGLTKNKVTGSIFDYKDGFYSGGLEALFFMSRWQSFVVRTSVGVDLGRWIGKKYINTDWREECSKYEITFGLGLHY